MSITSSYTSLLGLRCPSRRRHLHRKYSTGVKTELTEILKMIFGPRPARIAILGPGGYGKTTLASAVLAHRSVRQHFGDARYFVACESATTSRDLLIELAKGLGLIEAGSDALLGSYKGYR
jgi:AAA+ ATPase superfamily predicted ATPase